MRQLKVTRKAITAVSLTVLFSTFSGWAKAQSAAYTAPDPILTPGVLCTPDDPNFSGLAYPEQVPKCNRNVNQAEKLTVAASYGNIPQSEWPNYEFDHLIPLCAGGSDDPKNLWPQPISLAHEKDKLEVDICIQMRAGTLAQADAVRKVRDWISHQQQLQPSQPSQPAPPPQQQRPAPHAPADQTAVQPALPAAPDTAAQGPKRPVRRRSRVRHSRSVPSPA